MLLIADMDCGCKFSFDILAIRALAYSDFFGLPADTSKVIFVVAIETDLSPGMTSTRMFKQLMVLTATARTGFFWLRMLLFFVI